MTNELKKMVGQETYRATSPPVALSDIRKYAIAVYWPEKPPRLFWDEEYARQTVWGGIIAPEGFNPFAWPIEGPGRFPYFHGLADKSSLNAGSDAQYFAPIRPGDIINAVDTVVDVYERTGRNGQLTFVISQTYWTNQRGELVKIHRSTAAVQ